MVMPSLCAVSSSFRDVWLRLLPPDRVLNASSLFDRELYPANAFVVLAV